MVNNAGDSWILLRGLTREAGHWGGFISRLHNEFPGSRFYPIDLPGSGLSYQEASPCAISEVTGKVRELANHKGYLQGRVLLLAVSLGGMVAWDWLLRYPDEVAGVVLINSSLAGISPFYRRLRWQSYEYLARIVCEKNPYRRELKIVQLISNCKEKHRIIAEEWGAIQKIRPVSGLNAVRQLIAAARYRPGLAKPASPVLLLNSSGDRLVSPCCSRLISQHLSLPLATHPWAGHDICQDDPAWVIRRLDAWLNFAVSQPMNDKPNRLSTTITGQVWPLS
jgi:pimeloyl-ACP methyl ester carboxylesterase